MASLPYSFTECYPDSIEESWEPDRSTATRSYIGPWANRINFCRFVLGGPKNVVTAGGDTYITRQIPHEYPVDLTTRPVGTALYASRISRVTGVGNPSSGNTYEDPTGVSGSRISVFEKARVTVQYEARPYIVLSDGAAIDATYGRNECSLRRFVTKQAVPNVEIRTMMMGAFKYVASGTPIVETGSHKTFASYNLQITWHQVPDYAVPSLIHNPRLSSPSYIDDCIGRVNNAAFNGYPVGTLLLLGVQFRPYQMAFPWLEVRCYDITYQIKYFNPVSGAGHNHVYTTLATPGVGWWEVTNSGASNSLYADNYSIYNYYDFTKLFTPVVI